MIDLSNMPATELQQMLTNIYAVASAYEMEESTKLERITIMFDTDAAEKIMLLDNDPEEYFKQKYSQEATYTEDEVIALINTTTDLPGLQGILDIVVTDRPKYAPQTFEVICKVIYYAMHLARKDGTEQRTSSLTF